MNQASHTTSPLLQTGAFATALVLTFGVGILVGQRACHPTSEVQNADQESASTRCPKPTIVERRVEVPQIVYQCPPKETAKPNSVGKSKKAKAPTKLKDNPKLPKAKPLVPGQRRQLLAWARKESQKLKKCRDNSKEVWRLSVTLHLDAETTDIKRVSLNGPPGVIPAQALECMKRELLRWTPPKPLAQGQPQLVFGLNL